MGIDPATLSMLSTIATVGSTIIGVAGAQSTANANADAQAYQAQVARNNQTIADQYAAQAKQEGDVQAQNKQMETAQRLGAVRAAVGAGGLEVDSGSPLRLTQDTKALGDLDAQTIRYNAAQKAYGYQIGASNYGAQADLDTTASANARRSGDINSVGAIISGGAAVSDKWLKYKQVGLIT